MRVLLIGAGGVGDAATRIAAERDFFDLWLIADYDLERAKKSARAAITRGGSRSRFVATQVDASSAEAVANLAQQHQITHIFNAVDPRFVMPAPAKHRKPGVDLCAEAREVGLLYAFKR